MNLIAEFYVGDYEPRELTPLDRYLPFDLERSPPYGWCQVTYQDGFAIIHVPLNYDRFAMETLGEMIGKERQRAAMDRSS
jgi:hypothetical protein